MKIPAGGQTYDPMWRLLLEQQEQESLNVFATPGDFADYINPKNKHTPALDLIDRELVNLMNTPDSRLIISMPPQEGKSVRVAGDFPAWALLQEPDWRIITASYGQRLADRNGRSIRRRISNYPELGLEIAPDHGGVSEWSIKGRDGSVFSVGIGGGVTGMPADLMIIDDPIKNRKEAESEMYRDTVWDWWTDEASTRFGAGTRVALIMTRWHEDDLAGRLLERDSSAGWRELNIPAQCEDPLLDPLGREVGEFMVSARGRNRRQWEQRKRTAGSRTWNALFQGRPTAAEGGVFKREWMNTNQYQQPLWLERSDGTCVTTSPGDELMISADFAFKDKETSDPISIGVWMRRGVNVYLLDRINGRHDFLASRSALRGMAAKWPQAILKLVEDKANGTAIIRSLRSFIPGIVPEEPRGGKMERAHAITPFWEGGNVYLPAPEICPWVSEYIEELAAFPNGKNDDDVDMTTQAVNRLLLAPLLSGEDLTDNLFDELDDRGFVYSPW